MLLDPENIGIAVGISLLSFIPAEIYVFQVLRLPSWIFNFRFLPVWYWSYGIANRSMGQLDPDNIGLALGIVLLSGVQAKIHAFEV